MTRERMIGTATVILMAPGASRAGMPWRLRVALVAAAAWLALHPAVGAAQQCVTSADCGTSDQCNFVGCVHGQCVIAAPVCNDRNPCTIDGCEPTQGCVFIPGPAGTSCSNGNLCDGAEVCDDAGSCLPGTPLAAGASCSDGNLCNGEEACDGGGACASGTPLVCDDGHACTTDSCSPSAGCIAALKPSTAVCRPAADAECDSPEYCDGSSLDCPADAYEPDGSACDDANSDSVGESCEAGVCGCSGDDLDGDTIPDLCDPIDASILIKKATAGPARSKPGWIKAKGTLQTGVFGAADAIDTSEGFTVTVTDGLGMEESRSVSGAQCETRPRGSVQCAESGLMRLLLKPNAKSPGQYDWKIQLQDLDFAKPQLGPLTVTLTDGRQIDRVGSASNCKNTQSSLTCK